jgi:ribose transport system permease protein
LARAKSVLGRYALIIIFVALIIISACLSDVFFTSVNIFNVLRQSAMVGIVSMGMLLVILTGGIDLSVGSLFALSSVMVAKLQNVMPWPAATLLVLLMGLMLGMINGFLITRAKVAPFVITLSMMSVARGLAFSYSKGAAILVPFSSFELIGTGYVGPVPVPVCIMVLVFIIVAFMLERTTFGRIVIGIGGNEEAMRLAGVNTNRHKTAVYMISGFLSALAGVIITARMGVGSPITGEGMELDAIAAVVVGGANMAGGEGNVLNTVLGVLTLALIGNILNLLNVPAYPQYILKGLIIAVAVVSRRRSELN